MEEKEFREHFAQIWSIWKKFVEEKKRAVSVQQAKAGELNQLRVSTPTDGSSSEAEELKAKIELLEKECVCPIETRIR